MSKMLILGNLKYSVYNYIKQKSRKKSSSWRSWLLLLNVIVKQLINYQNCFCCVFQFRKRRVLSSSHHLMAPAAACQLTKTRKLFCLWVVATSCWSQLFCFPSTLELYLRKTALISSLLRCNIQQTLLHTSLNAFWRVLHWNICMEVKFYSGSVSLCC